VNDWTLQQLCDWVQTEHGIRVGVTTMWKTLARLGLSLKKSHSMPASKRAQM
jgi:transposase